MQIRNTAPENHTHAHWHTGQTLYAAPFCPSLTALRPLSWFRHAACSGASARTKQPCQRVVPSPSEVSRLGYRSAAASMSPRRRPFSPLRARPPPRARRDYVEIIELEDLTAACTCSLRRPPPARVEAHHISGDTWMTSVSGACLCAMSSSCFVNLRFSPSSSSHRLRVLT